MNHLGALALQEELEDTNPVLSDKQAGHSCRLCYSLTVWKLYQQEVLNTSCLQNQGFTSAFVLPRALSPHANQ